MAFAGFQDAVEVNEYASNLVNTPPTLDLAPSRATYEVGFDEQGQPEWIDLYHRDKAFAALTNSLFSLYFEDDETPPSDNVVDWILESSVLPKKLLAGSWRNPRITTDDEGGIRLSWREGDRELRAVIPADLSKRYLYWQNGTEYGGFTNFGSATLYSCLSRMNERTR